ncbi:hypothetical protein [Exiguobacterium mexicanum]
MEPVTTAAAINAGATLLVKMLEAREKTSFAWLDGQKAKARNAKTLTEAQSIYEETINQFQQANADLENIARAYKDLYEQVVISDKDIEFLNATLRSALEIFRGFGDFKESDVEAWDSLISLVNKDLLKSMQLLGFNYKEAIGVPLTEACASYITSKLGPISTATNQAKGKRR